LLEPLNVYVIGDERVFHDPDDGWRCSCIDYQEDPQCEHVERASALDARRFELLSIDPCADPRSLSSI
jgi:hypothetical protein